jgi:DNA invertase Pin-like site-specific DNA recombinase
VTSLGPRTCDGLRVGYLREEPDLDGARAMLVAARCQVVRLEARLCDAPGPVLQAILRFLKRGDSLVVANLQSLGSAATALSTLQTLESCGAILEVLDPPLSSGGEGGGNTLAARLGHSETANAGSSATEIFALHEAGVGPSEIARRLGVSRMTVWRRLRAHAK